jgi:uncharacterized membrane protein YbhN (UPF0104 family)
VRRDALRVSLGVLLGAGALWFSFRGTSIPDVTAALRDADAAWLVAATAATLVALGGVAHRWQLILLPDPVPYAITLKATVVGQMMNILLPLRLGEVARVFPVSAHARLPLTRVAASVAVEKGLDVAVFGIAAAWLVAASVVPAGLIATERWLIWPLGAVLVLAAVFAAGWFKIRWSVLAWTIAIFILAAAGNQLLFLAFGLSLPLSAGVALLVVLQAGSVPPSLPGRLGIYNYLTVVTLGLYGVDRTQALGYSLALYVVAFAPKLVLGAIVAMDRSWRPSWVTRGAESTDDTEQRG